MSFQVPIPIIGTFGIFGIFGISGFFDLAQNKNPNPESPGISSRSQLWCWAVTFPLQTALNSDFCQLSQNKFL